ncbi:MAG: hypothetical protein KJ718_05020 [Nanoarchaeota archaeon]|nr:hypothetical protein [Nanoarchaeota archaeon]MBU1051887.1 hypothetical protein [Nanoarchaeota archaeon]MBU1988505.1 hypothetical protein [Nanoarchaeota archaeon]
MQILTVLKTPRIPYNRILDDLRHAPDFSQRVLDTTRNSNKKKLIENNSWSILIIGNVLLTDILWIGLNKLIVKEKDA